MPRIIVGYGEFKGRTLPEVSHQFLQELSQRFPLKSGKYDTSEGWNLLVTVAIHEEIERRRDGGEQKKGVPTLKELAVQLVAAGFRHLSKIHHPDRDGALEAQQKLTQVREYLTNACDGIADENYDAVVISGPGPTISDEDIPF